jgi:hypothetical protein
MQLKKSGIRFGLTVSVSSTRFLRVRTIALVLFQRSKTETQKHLFDASMRQCAVALIPWQLINVGGFMLMFINTYNGKSLTYLQTGERNESNEPNTFGKCNKTVIPARGACQTRARKLHPVRRS